LQERLERLLVNGFSLLALAVGLDQIIGARQAADMAGDDAIVTPSHKRLPFLLLRACVLGAGRGHPTRGV
jgi:hypothetical protein